MNSGFILFILLFVGFIACDQPTTNDPAGVVGVWQIKKITNQDVSEPLVNDSLPSLFIFTPHHYSMVWVLSEEP